MYKYTKKEKNNGVKSSSTIILTEVNNKKIPLMKLICNITNNNYMGKLKLNYGIKI